MPKIVCFAYNSSNGFTDSEISYIAANYDILVIQWNQTYPTALKASITKLKQLKPSLLILIYISAISSGAYIDYYGDWNIINSNESWFLHDINGSRLRISWSSGWYAMDLRVAAYRQFIVDWCVNTLTANPLLDGIFNDNTWDDFYMELWTVPRASVIDVTTWYADMTNFLSYLKGRIGAKLLMPNTSDNASYVAASDGKLAEGWVNEGIPYEYSGYTIPQYLTSIKQGVTDKGKIFLAIDATATEAEFYYSFCSFLLVANNASAYESLRWDQSANGTPIDSSGFLALARNALALLGSPTTDFSQLTNVLLRDFQGGRIMVNYSTSIMTVNLGGTFKELNGTLVTSVTMAPHTGIILLSITAPPTSINFTFSSPYQTGQTVNLALQKT